MFCLMFLIDGIKPNVEKKFKTCLRGSLWGGGVVGRVRNKSNFVSFRVRFAGGKKKDNEMNMSYKSKCHN